VTLLAAMGWVFSKNALAGFAPYQFIALRFLLAALVLALFCSQQLLGLSRDQLLRSATTGLVFGCTLLLWVLALDRTPYIGEGAFIASLTVVIVPIMGRLFFGTRVTVKLMLSLIPAVAGLACLSIEGGIHFGSYQSLFFAAAVGFSLHLNLSNHFVKNIPPLALASIQLGVAGVIALLAALLKGPWVSAVTFDIVAWLLCSALLATSLRFALQTRALQTLVPSHASMIFLAEPVWTAMLGAMWLGERMSAQQWLGCALIFTALLIFRGGEFVRYVLASRDKKPAI
jgi:drug/metabolite transporter (DMT)-like permease